MTCRTELSPREGCGKLKELKYGWRRSRPLSTSAHSRRRPAFSERSETPLCQRGCIDINCGCEAKSQSDQGRSFAVWHLLYSSSPDVGDQFAQSLEAFIQPVARTAFGWIALSSWTQLSPSHLHCRSKALGRHSVCVQTTKFEASTSLNLFQRMGLRLPGRASTIKRCLLSVRFFGLLVVDSWWAGANAACLCALLWGFCLVLNKSSLVASAVMTLFWPIQSSKAESEETKHFPIDPTELRLQDSLLTCRLSNITSETLRGCFAAGPKVSALH